jgi:predicted metalloprotease
VKVDKAVSPHVIDRRKHIGAGVIGGVLATVFGLLGFRAFSTTGTDKDPDRDLVFVVSTALDRGQAELAARVPMYRFASVVLFDGETQTACGVGLTSAGPFYCSGDERIYMDLSFLRAIHGDFARAYVVFHELGHHLQKLRSARPLPGASTELEADCFAGEMMRTEQRSGHLMPGDVAAALEEAAEVGDDRLRPGSSPESWTHGSSAQRVAAVSAGLAGQACP